MIGARVGLRVIGFAALAVVFWTQALPAQAQTERLGEFRAWSAYVDTSNDQKTCFVISQPSSSEMNPAGRQRGPAHIFIAIRPTEQVRGEVSVIYGYPLREGSTRAEVGATTFPLFARDENAWIENVADEPRLVDSMRRGATMRVFGTSTRGTETIDTYSLSGITAAMNRAQQECAN